MRKAAYCCALLIIIGFKVSGFEMSAGISGGAVNVLAEPLLVQTEMDLRPSQTFTVTTVLDGTGNGTLRTAIMGANANPGLDTIVFSVPGSGVRNLQIATSLPQITDPVIIDGSTQPGYAGNPLINLGPTDSGVTAVIDVTGGNSTIRALTFGFFSGVTVGNGVIRLGSNNNVVVACAGGIGNSQVLIDGGANNRIGGFVPVDRNIWYGNSSNRDVVIVKGATATGNRIIGNWFGTTPAGARLANAGRDVFIDNAPSNLVGGIIGTTPGACTGECNALSGSNIEGLRISGPMATGNIVKGNFIGLAVDGVTANPNLDYSINIVNAPGNIIGGSTPAERNVIVAGGFGDVLVGAGSDSTVITGNFVGLKSDGLSAITSNVPAYGITLNSNNNRVGGVTAGERNIIAGSNRGIIIGGNFNLVQGNYIGTDITGNVGLTTLFDGVYVTGADNRIGSQEGNSIATCTGGCNVISGNGPTTSSSGVVLAGTTATRNVVERNFIGLNQSGTAALRNGLPASGRSVLIFNASGNQIGTPLPPIAGRGGAQVNIVCIQDAVSDSYLRIDEETGSYEAKDCTSGEVMRSPPEADFDYYPNGIKKFTVFPRLTVLIYPYGAASASFDSTSIFGASTIYDDNVNDLHICTCPTTGYQFLIGRMEFGGPSGSNDNTAANNISGSSTDLKNNLSLVNEESFWVSTGIRNNFTSNYSAGQNIPNVKTTVGNTTIGGTYLHMPGVLPIVNGVSVFSGLNAIRAMDKMINLTGRVATGIPNEKYTVEVFKTVTYETGREIDGVKETAEYQKSTGVMFTVTTDNQGQTMFTQTITGPQADLLWQQGDLTFTATDAGRASNIQSDDSSDLVAEAFGTSEMSLPVHLPGVELTGRVTTPDSRGLRNALVSMVDNSTGVRRNAVTSTFGVYSFGDVGLPKTYTITVSSKRFRFASRVVQVSDYLSEINFVGQE